MKRAYKMASGKTAHEIGERVRVLLESEEKMETQTIITQDGYIIIQGRVHHGILKQWIEMFKTVMVKLSKNGAYLEAEVTNGIWHEKELAKAVSTFVLLPLALMLTPEIDMYKQGKLARKIQQVISEAV